MTSAPKSPAIQGGQYILHTIYMRLGTCRAPAVDCLHPGVVGEKETRTTQSPTLFFPSRFSSSNDDGHHGYRYAFGDLDSFDG